MRRVELGEFLEVLDTLEGTGVGAWGLDIESSRLKWSANIGPLFGREAGYAPATLEESFELIYPDDVGAVAEAVDAAITHGSDYEVDLRVVWPDGSLHWLTARGHAILDAEGEKAVRVVGVISDATERKRASEQTRFLATAAAHLGRTLDIDETLRELAQLLIDGLSDWCSVQLLADGLLGEQVVVAHRDPEKLELVERLNKEYPPGPEPEGVAAAVVESGQGVLLEVIDDELLRESATDESHYRLLKSLGLRSALVVPLATRGRVLGVMTLASAESRIRFTERDLRFAEEVGRRAAMAVDNARLHQNAVEAAEDANRVSRRLMAMQTVLASLSQAVDVASVANVAIVEGAGTLGAARGAVVLRRDDRVEMVASVGYPIERIEAYSGMLDRPGPLRDALETASPVYVESVSNLVDRYPNLVDAMAGVVSGAFSAVPLITTEGAIGAMGFVYDQDRPLSHEDRAFTSSLAQHVGLAIERSMQFDASRRMVDVLHSAIAPNPVDDGEVPAAARFRAASYGAIGGDWYDMVTTPDRRRMFVVGDVVGRGMQAVGAMAALRHSLRMLLQVGYSPDRAFSELNRLASVERSAMGTTAICVEADGGSRRIRVTSAGHLPPILLSGASARPVWVENGPPLGVGGSAETSELTLRSDEFLILYSDGAVERPGESVDESLEALCSLLSEQSGDEHQIADSVLRHAPDTGDDLTILVISGRRPSLEASGG